MWITTVVSIWAVLNFKIQNLDMEGIILLTLLISSNFLGLRLVSDTKESIEECEETLLELEEERSTPYQDSSQFQAKTNHKHS